MPAEGATIAGLLLKGFLLGWSVAWPPGPINAEMIRRGLNRHRWSATSVGLGACSGDFLWALAVASGLGLVANRPAVRLVLGVVSLTLLVLLAGVFLRGAWEHRRSATVAPVGGSPPIDSTRSGYALGFMLALMSPWNIAFWLGAMGSATGGQMTFAASMLLAGGVIAGALTWVLCLNTAVALGARFASPAWEVATRALTGVLMLCFAALLALRLLGR